MEAISFENFSMKYNEGDFSLSDINLTIHEGDFVVLTGGTGSGKSTLIRQLKREFVANNYEGSVRVFDREMRDMSRVDTLSVGYVMQSASEQIVTDKVFHELAFGLENMGLTSDEIRLRVSETAHYFGLSQYMDRSTHELSGGEMQILNLASVMAMRPRILLLDEPTSQLDEVTADKFLSLVYRINRELGTTIIIAEHRLDMLTEHDKVVIMDRGKVVYDGNEPTHYAELPIYVRLGEVLGEQIHNITSAREVLKSRIHDYNPMDEALGEASPTEKALSVRDVWYRYSREANDVLRGVDMDVMRGEIFAIVGGNGAGKSTLLSIVSGVRPFYKGKVKTYGNKVVYIPQNVAFLYDSVGAEISHAIDAYTRRYIDANKKAKITAENVEKYRENLRENAEKYLDIFALKYAENRSPYQISGGEKEKLAIIIGLLSSPDILLLDEPTRGLDRESKGSLKDMISSLKMAKKTIILVSHDLEFISSVSDRVGTLFDGQILSICTPKMLLRTNYLFTTTTSRITRGIMDDIVTEDALLDVAKRYSN